MKVPTEPTGESKENIAAAKQDADGNVVGTPEYGYGQTGTLDGQGNFTPLDPQPPSPTIKEWKKWRSNWLASRMLGMARGVLGRRSDQIAQIAWADKFVQVIIRGISELFPKHPGGRPLLPNGAKSDVERKRKEREHKKEWAWLPFEIISDANYLVMESRANDQELFDFEHCAVITGRQLRAELETQREMQGDFGRTQLEDLPAVVIIYQDHVRYFIPDIRQKTVDEVLAGKGGWSLNGGRFMKDAPEGLGLLLTGWGHKKGYQPGKSESEPELEDVEARTAWAPKASRAEAAETELENVVDSGVPLQDDANETGSDDEIKCKLCDTVLENNYQQAVDHLQENHPKEYQQLRRAIADWQREQKTDAKRHEERRKRCREDHERMLMSVLEQYGPGAYHCVKCDVLLCQHRHPAMTEAKFKDGEARRNAIETVDDRRSFKIGPFYCDICHTVLSVTPFEVTTRPTNPFEFS